MLKSVENMGLMDKTAIIFTTDHGFYFGEHGGLFGKMSGDRLPDGRLRPYGDPGSTWTHSPLFEEIVHIPLLVHAPGISPGVYKGLSSAIDVMPTVLDLLNMEIPAFVQGRSLVPRMQDNSLSGRDYVVSSIPFANPGDPVHSVDNLLRTLSDSPVTTITAGEWSLLYTPEEGRSELFNLKSDPNQLNNVIRTHIDEAREIHKLLVEFMRETNVPDRLQKPRLELRP